jgi:hypothetical protein
MQYGLRLGIVWEFVLQLTLTADGVSPRGRGLGWLVTARSEGTYVQYSELRETDPTVLARTVQNHFVNLRFGRKDAPCLQKKIPCQVGPAGVTSTRAEGMRIKRRFDDVPMLRKAQHDQVTGIPPGLRNKVSL